MKQLFDDLSRFLTDSLDNSEISKHFEKLNKILENYLHNEEDKAREIIKFYFLASEVSKNKTVSSLSTQGGRTDFTSNTLYNIYSSDDNSVIGETVAFYSKVKRNLKNMYLYNIISTTAFSRGNVFYGISSAIFDDDEKKFIFPNVTIETVDFNGKKIRVEKLPDDSINPDKVHYQISFFD